MDYSDNKINTKFIASCAQFELSGTSLSRLFTLIEKIGNLDESAPAPIVIRIRVRDKGIRRVKYFVYTDYLHPESTRS